MTIEELQTELRAFAQARGWGRHHDPKSLTMALAVEVGEVMEHFQWLGEAESYAPADPQGVQEELADVLIYLVQLANQLNVNLTAAVAGKLLINSVKYPATPRQEA